MYRDHADENWPGASGQGISEGLLSPFAAYLLHRCVIPLSLLGGLFNNKNEFYDTKMGSNIATARHALAIDEKREEFEPEPCECVDLKQVWSSVRR